MLLSSVLLSTFPPSVAAKVMLVASEYVGVVVVVVFVVIMVLFGVGSVVVVIVELSDDGGVVVMKVVSFDVVMMVRVFDVKTCSKKSCRRVVFTLLQDTSLSWGWKLHP